MWQFVTKLFDTKGFPDRWSCGRAWEEEVWLGWLHIVSDIATFAAYYAVPCVVDVSLPERRTAMGLVTGGPMGSG